MVLMLSCGVGSDDDEDDDDTDDEDVDEDVGGRGGSIDDLLTSM